MNQLEQQLQQARESFPRFYFLSNDELIKLLEEQNLNTLQEHLDKLFEAITKAKIVDDKVEGVFSKNDEYLSFSQPVVYTKNNVLFLQQLEQAMKVAVKEQIMQGLKNFDEKQLLKFIDQNLNQVVLSVIEIKWTEQVEKSIQTQKLQELYQNFNAMFQSLIKFQADKEKNPLYKIKIFNSLCLLHQIRRGIESLIQNKVQNIEDSNWQGQFRKYAINDEIVGKMNECTQEYTYEYIGCAESLAQTSQEVYSSLLEALKNNKLGGNYGPAGTGKTETIKELGKKLGRLVVVCNCSDQLDHLAMKKFLEGGNYSGCWFVLDEFNRIDEDQLNLMHSQFESFLNGTLAKNKKSSSGVFYTYNPGYAGSSLSQGDITQKYNAISQVVAMPAVNLSLIIEILMYSEGFTTSPQLTQKFIQNQDFCKKKLSKQVYYDFGLRQIKAVINQSGALLRKIQKEEEALFNSLWMINKVRLTQQDLDLYQDFLAQTFPGMKFSIDGQKENQIREILKEIAQNKDEDFVQKLIIFYYQQSARHGWLLLGDDYKEFLYMSLELQNKIDNNKILLENYDQENHTPEQMYGFMDDNNNNNYVEGEVVKFMRRQFASQQEYWLCMNGKFGAINLENLNTTLDDNKKLCLINGEIIDLKRGNKIFIATDNCDQFSPATVSRLGVINLSKK